MFLRYLAPLARPYWFIRTRLTGITTAKGNFRSDINRMKAYRRMAKDGAGKAKNKVKGAKGKALGMAGKGKGIKGKGAKGKVGVGAGAGVAGKVKPVPQGGKKAQGGGKMADVRKVGLFRKKLVCNKCNRGLDAGWDHCHHCAQVGSKTQAFVVDHASGGLSHMQLLGWLVPVKGPQRGELFNLAPESSVGTDEDCTVCLFDQYMSGRHAEIKVEAGAWVLLDLGSTNGTYVNDRRVDRHELVDNDFVRFGQSLVKFKSL